MYLVWRPRATCLAHWCILSIPLVPWKAYFLTTSSSRLGQPLVIYGDSTTSNICGQKPWNKTRTHPRDESRRPRRLKIRWRIGLLHHLGIGLYAWCILCTLSTVCKFIGLTTVFPMKLLLKSLLILVPCCYFPSGIQFYIWRKMNHPPLPQQKGEVRTIFSNLQ